MISAEDVHDPAAGRLLIANPADGSLRDVLPNYLGHVTAIAWQNNDTVMFLGDEGVWTTFSEIRRDGTQRKTHVGRRSSSPGRFRFRGTGNRLRSSSTVRPTRVTCSSCITETPVRSG